MDYDFRIHQCVPVLEIANKHLQPHAFTLLNIGSALAIIATTLLASAVSYWRYLQLLSSVPFLFLPLIAWYDNVFYECNYNTKRFLGTALNLPDGLCRKNVKIKLGQC